MKCERCGKDFGDVEVEVCDECGYNFEEGKRIKKALNEHPEHSVSKEKATDLIDYPILSFILGILGLVVPFAIFSIIAIILGKKEAKERLKPFANLGFVFGIIGIAVSSVVIITIIISLF